MIDAGGRQGLLESAAFFGVKGPAESGGGQGFDKLGLLPVSRPRVERVEVDHATGFEAQRCAAERLGQRAVFTFDVEDDAADAAQDGAKQH